MDLLNIIIIAFGLSMDAFAVAITIGLCLSNRKTLEALRVSWHFGFFQFIMPIIGYFSGKKFSKSIMDYDHWVAFGLLVGIGIHMVLESMRKKAEKAITSKGELELLLLSIATSIDALAIGFSFALLDVLIFFPSLVIGFVTAVFSYAGVEFGHFLGKRFSSYVKLLGGFILIGMGVKILLEHVFL